MPFQTPYCTHGNTSSLLVRFNRLYFFSFDTISQFNLFRRPQIQVQLECTDLDECYFVQWAPSHLAVDGQEVFSITVVERDRQWFADNVDALKSFHTDLMELRKTYVPPPPPTCSINMNLYENHESTTTETSCSDDIVIQNAKRTYVIESSDSEDEEFRSLKHKLQSALEALDSWSHRKKNK